MAILKMGFHLVANFVSNRRVRHTERSSPCPQNLEAISWTCEEENSVPLWPSKPRWPTKGLLVSM
jgi:hypothetical protein